MAVQTIEALLKIVIIGDTSVGKTCLILRYTHDTFRENFLSTIGVDFKTRVVAKDGKNYKLQIWDTAGQERYNTIRKNFYRGAKGVVIVYDMTNVDSFNSVAKWIEDVMTNVDPESSSKPQVLILANKLDLEEEQGRKIDALHGEDIANRMDALFAEVSAKTGEGVEKAFDGLVDRMCKMRLESQRQEEVFSIKLNETPEYEQTDGSTCSC